MREGQLLLANLSGRPFGSVLAGRHLSSPAPRPSLHLTLPPCPTYPPHARLYHSFLHSALVHSRPVDGASAGGVPTFRSPAAKRVRACGCRRRPLTGRHAALPAAARRSTDTSLDTQLTQQTCLKWLQESVLYYNIEGALALVVSCRSWACLCARVLAIARPPQGLPRCPAAAAPAARAFSPCR